MLYASGMEKSCGIILYTFIEGIRYYLLISNNDEIGFPKGHLEIGETERECALREVFEETSIIPIIDNTFYQSVIYYMPNHKQKYVVYFLDYFENQLPKHQDGFEYFDYLLLTYEEALKSLSHDNLKKILINAESILNQSNK